MQLFDPNNPNEKKKVIVAAVLGLASIILLGYLFLGGSSKPAAPRAKATATPTPAKRIQDTAPAPENGEEDLSMFQPIVYPRSVPAVGEANRNIFAYYEPPKPQPTLPPPPSPTPTPPLVAYSVTPQNVYARTGDFSLQVMGDRFEPGVNIVIDGRPMQTRFVSKQQLATTVPADMIANPGNRQIVLKNNNGSLFSNSLSLNISPPPVPNVNYVGLIGRPRGNDLAVLQDKNSKEFLNVQRGDMVGGRFRLTSIADKEIVLLDVNLKITHTITFTESANAPSRPTNRRTPVDDEP